MLDIRVNDSGVLRAGPTSSARAGRDEHASGTCFSRRTLYGQGCVRRSEERRILIEDDEYGDASKHRGQGGFVREGTREGALLQLGQNFESNSSSQVHPSIRQNAQRHISRYAIVAAAGILLLLWISFRRWQLALLGFLTLPVALIGGELSVAAHTITTC